MRAFRRPDDDGLKDGGREAITMTEDLPEEETVEVTVEEPELEPEPVDPLLSLIHISEPTRHASISYAVFCLKKYFFNDTATTEIYTP